jgi:RyR domain
VAHARSSDGAGASASATAPTGGTEGVWGKEVEARRSRRAPVRDELPLAVLPFLLFLFLAVLALGAWGYSEVDDRGDDLYRSLQLFVLDYDPAASDPKLKLQAARFLAPALAAIALLLGIALVLREWLRSLRIRLFRGHVVVVGKGPDALGIARAFTVSGNRVVVLTEGPSAGWAQACESAGAIPVSGVISDRETFRRVRVDRARYAFLLCESDARSIEAGEAALGAAEGHRSAQLQILTKIADPELRIHRAAHRLARGDAEGPSLDVFDPVDVAARALVEQRREFLDSAAKSERAPRALVGGADPIGEALLLHLARAWQRSRGNGTEKLRLTLVDPDASTVVASLQARYRELEQLCVLDPRDHAPGGPEWLRGEPLAAGEGMPVDACFVCGEDEESVIRPALSAHYHLRGSGAMLTVCTADTFRTARAVLDDLEDEPLPSIHSVIELACAPEIVLRGTRELLARATHEDYVRQALAREESPETNPSMVEWDELSEDMRESNRAQADDIGVKLRELGCTVVPAVFQGPQNEEIRFPEEEIERLAEAEHERWAEERKRSGWVYGESRNDARKTHPLLVAWEQLSETDKEKDRDTVRDLPRRLARHGFAVVELD